MASVRAKRRPTLRDRLVEPVDAAISVSPAKVTGLLGVAVFASPTPRVVVPTPDVRFPVLAIRHLRPKTRGAMADHRCVAVVDLLPFGIRPLAVSGG